MTPVSPSHKAGDGVFEYLAERPSIGLTPTELAYALKRPVEEIETDVAQLLVDGRLNAGYGHYSARPCGQESPAPVEVHYGICRLPVGHRGPCEWTPAHTRSEPGMTVGSPSHEAHRRLI